MQWLQRIALGRDGRCQLASRAGCDPGRPANFFRQQHLGTLTRLPVPAQHGGQSDRGEREPNKPANQMHARLRRGLGALRLAFVVVSHVRSSNSRLRHCKLGRKKTSPGCRNWRPNFLRPGCRGRSQTARPQKNFGPQRRQGPTRFLRRAPFLDDRVDAFDHQDGDAAEEAKPNIARPSQMSLIKIKRC